jgi:hypothetical protein
MNLWYTVEQEFIKYLPLISALLIGLAGPVGVVYYKHWLYRKNTLKATLIKKKREDFDNTLTIQEGVNRSLNSLQAKYDLDRIWISQFHNGGNFYPGNKSMKKMSVTFESTAPGIAADIMKMQSLPISFFSTCLQQLNLDVEGVKLDIFTENDFALKDYWQTKGANTVYLFPIKSIDGLFIAVLGVEFIKRDEDLTEEEYKKLANEAKLLSGYIAALSIDKS